jgi:hypothetical protein
LPVPTPPPAPYQQSSAPPRRERRDPGRADRGLRGLETVRSSQLTPVEAMRAREYGRPTAKDLADAERDVVLVRRNYVPPTPLQTGKKRSRRRDGPSDQPGSTGGAGSAS